MRSPLRASAGADVRDGATIDQVLAELRQLHALVRQVLSDRASHLTRSDRERLARILPAVAGVFGSELFAVRELFANRAPALPVVLQDENPKALGRLFKRAASVTVEGLVVRGEGSELNATLWRIWRVDEFSSQ